MAQETFNLPDMPSQVRIVTQQPGDQNDPRHQNKSILFRLGITEIVIGSLSFFMSNLSFAVVDFSPLIFAAPGNWCGIFVIICGTLGIAVKMKPTRCMYVANMTMTIITALITCFGAVVSGFVAAFVSHVSGLLVIHIAATALIVSALVMTIIHSAFCCSGVCRAGDLSLNRQPQMVREEFNLPEMPNQVPIVTEHPDSQDDPRHQNKNILFRLGITEIVVGSLSTILAVTTIIILPQEFQKRPKQGFIDIDFSRPFTYFAQGISCGIFITICGILGVIVKKTPTRPMFVANMTLTIITAIFSSLGTISSGIAVAASGYSSALVGLHATITALIVIAFVIAIVHSAFCCKGARCCAGKPSASQRHVVSS